jgi:LAS superfamily LD-carboxypeptidase LdcB
MSSINQGTIIQLLYSILIIVLLSCRVSGTEKNEITDLPLEEAFLVPSDTTPNPATFWSLNYIMGKFDPAQDTLFTLVAREYADREGLLLRKETYEAFKKMHQAALADGISLVIRSATRNFDYQKTIWEKKWKGETPLEGNYLATKIAEPIDRAKAILRYSSMPGTSRHHWGTDIDLNAFNNSYFETGEGQRIYVWLLDRAASFGFCQPYTAKGEQRPVGYEEERWHWSYLPLSKSLLEEARQSLNSNMISGFLGSEVAVTLNVVQDYVLGIDSSCVVTGTQADH